MSTNKVVGLAVCCILVFLLTSSSAFAITGNYQPDSRRGCVGLVASYNLDAAGNLKDISVGSGVLISPQIMLTAAHVLTGQYVAVCFDAGPIAWDVNVLESCYFGTPYRYPGFAVNVAGKNGLPYTFSYDVGVIVLDEEVPPAVVGTFGYGQLPAAGAVDALKSQIEVTLVGYGVQEQLTPKKGEQSTWTGLLMRNSAASKLLPSNFAWNDEFVRCTANPGNGRGGIAFGDSGGPVFLGEGNTVLALHSYVVNQNCAGVSYHSRIDVPTVLSWIQSFGGE